MPSQEISNLEIVIKDNATQAATSVKNLADALGMLKRNGAGLEKIASSVASINKASNTSGIKKAVTAIDEMSSKATKMATTINNANTSFNALGKSTGIAKATSDIEGFQAVLNKIDLQGSLKNWASRAGTTFTKITSSLKNFGGNVKEVLGRLVPQNISRTINQFNRMLRMRLLRTAAKAVLTSITEGLQNLYQWSRITGDGFASVMDGMATSSLYFKNSVGAAFGQLLTNIAPIITRLIDIIVDGINYINMFFAVLNGQSTYTRAKKYAVEYAEAATGAIGGATGAVEDFKEELSVLDFDELNQLQEAATPSSGGGGGGGTGSPAKDYSDMFEKANIEQNALTKTAGWLADNFRTVLDIVEAIGAGILAWKISSALNSALGNLLTLKQRVGITLMVTGFMLEYKGAYDMGRNGANLKNIIMTGLGAALGVAGSVLTFGSTPLGWAIGLGVAFTLFIVGYTEGTFQRIRDELYATSERYRTAADSIALSEKRIEDAQNRIANVKKVDNLIDDEEYLKWQTAGDLLDKIESFEGIDVSNADTSTLQAYVDTLNQILSEAGLDEHIDWWVDLNGKIQTTADSVAGVIAQMINLAKTNALQGYLEENYRSLYANGIELSDAKTTNYYNKHALEDAQRELAELQERAAEQDAQGGMKGIIDPQLDAEIQKKIIEIETYQEAYNKSAESVSALTEAQNTLETENSRIIEELYGTVEVVESVGNAADTASKKVAKLFSMPFNSAAGDVAQMTGQKYNEYDGFNAKPYQNVTPFSFVNPVQNQKGITAQDSQGLAIYADATRNATYQTQQFTKNTLPEIIAVDNVIDQFGEFTEKVDQNTRTQEEQTQKMTGHQASLKSFGNTLTSTATSSDGLTKSLKNIGTGMNLPKVRTGIQTELAPRLFTSTGTGIQSAIQTPVNAITANGKTVFNNINGAITAQQFNKPGEAVQKAIQTPINAITASGKKIFSSIKGNILDSSNNYGGIGGTMQSAMQGKVNATTANGKVIHKNIKNAINEYDYGGIGTDISKQINNNLNITKDFSSIPDILISSFKTSLDGFWKVGSAVGSQIKQGIINEVGNLNFITTATAGSTTQKLTGKITTQLYGLGGFPEMGELFIANEMGAEMVGRIGNRTAVANNDQIATALARALQPMLGGGGGTQTTNVTVEMDSATIARASYKGRTALNKQYNMRVSG